MSTINRDFNTLMHTIGTYTVDMSSSDSDVTGSSILSSWNGINTIGTDYMSHMVSEYARIMAVEKAVPKLWQAWFIREREDYKDSKFVQIKIDKYIHDWLSFGIYDKTVVTDGQLIVVAVGDTFEKEKDRMTVNWNLNNLPSALYHMLDNTNIRHFPAYVPEFFNFFELGDILRIHPMQNPNLTIELIITSERYLNQVHLTGMVYKIENNQPVPEVDNVPDAPAKRSIQDYAQLKIWV